MAASLIQLIEQLLSCDPFIVWREEFEVGSQDGRHSIQIQSVAAARIPSLEKQVKVIDLASREVDEGCVDSHNWGLTLEVTGAPR